jgi:soluble lytic murein transglycosylase-like protein
MKTTGLTPHLSCAANALKELLALVGVAAIFGYVLLPMEDALENPLPALAQLPSVVLDQLMPAAPALATTPVAASAGESAAEREQQAVAEFIAKRYRVAENAAAGFVSVAYRAGEKYSLDPLLILAVMAIESRYNPVAESNAGARGLMQVIPKYHPEKLEPHGGEESLLVPEVNILVGAQILREYLRRFGGDTETALQVYNGALDEPTSRYSNKVFAEKALLEAMRVKARSRTAQSA